jgi:hypothetical protein
MFSSLWFDEKIQKFQIMANGVTVTSFSPYIVTSIRVSETGALRKKATLALVVKFSDGDVTFAYTVPNKSEPQAIKTNLERIVRASVATENVIRLLGGKETTSILEVTEMLSKFYSPATDIMARKIIEDGISSGRVEGILEGQMFVSKYALQKRSKHSGIA